MNAYKLKYFALILDSNNSNGKSSIYELWTTFIDFHVFYFLLITTPILASSILILHMNKLMLRDVN